MTFNRSILIPAGAVTAMFLTAIPLTWSAAMKLASIDARIERMENEMTRLRAEVGVLQQGMNSVIHATR